MSRYVELIEMVSKAITPVQHPVMKLTADNQARAAVSAVAKWLDENYRSCPCTLSCASILKQLEEKE